MKLKFSFKKFGMKAAAAVILLGTLMAGECLLAYENDTVPSWERDVYAEKENKTGFWVLGAGGAVNSLPLASSKFTLPLIYLAYEGVNKKSLGNFDTSWSFGLYDFMPEAEFAVIMPVKPLDFRLSVGAYYDIIIGGHAGMLVKAGAILNKTYSFDVMVIPIGTQPSVSYSESLSQQKIVENDGKHGLEFPVFGVLASIRF
ncbi:MAG TPA: hypothetical protein PLB12_00075 [Candidatus Goldiibacteriota bacterium]|nr:hypothetical protein [Candidatus Goldiibacteriota bacterium]HPN63580.1 hypothetical protein [Candidatus Goldiibacteriota bacterium]HRQ42727.1 hypothetical protein [Candidatus Goldiibacteriota bacterium]